MTDRTVRNNYGADQDVDSGDSPTFAKITAVTPSSGATAGTGVGVGNTQVFEATGTPESKVTAPIGSLYVDNGASGALYRKDSGAGNTGWVIVGAASILTATVTTTNATPTELVRVAVPNNGRATVSSLSFTANDQTSITGASFSLLTAASNNAGDTTLNDDSGAAQSKLFDSDDADSALLAVTIAADNATEELVISVTGAAGKNIDWVLQYLKG